MKKGLLFLITVFSFSAFAQVFDAFNYTGAASANGWTTHSGTAAEILTLTTASQSGNSLSYTGLQASAGNRIALSSTATEDINKPFTSTTPSGYFSFLLNVTNTTGLTAAGAYFIGFGGTAGTNVTVYFPRLFIKLGTTANTFQLGILNTSGGTGAVATYVATEFTPGTTYLVVAKASSPAVGGVITSSIWVNPIPGAAEPAAGAVNAGGTSTWPANGVQSIFLRQAAGTGNYEIDEIRAGQTWASVTPAAAASCTTYNTIAATACTSYTLNSQTYTTSGTYIQTLANANSQGCDSIINLNLTIHNATSSTLNVTNCGPYTLNGQTYANAGTYTQLTTNVHGCDSTITLNLTIVGSLTYYQDADGDGYGNAAVSQVGCAAITGYVTNSTDCNDADNTIHPGAVEIAGNGIDEDCNGFDAPLQLGLYEFTGTAACPVVANQVTTQPTFATFGAFGNVGAACSPTANVFNNTGWNTSTVLDLNQYSEFSISGNDCYNLNLGKLALHHRTSSTGGTPVIHLRSSLDNYATDIDTIGSAWNGNNFIADTVILPSTFSNVHSVNFRFYLTGQATSTSTFRMDDVSLYGNAIALTPSHFYADADADGFGDPLIDSLACNAPAGYVNNNLDCNDANAAVNPNTVWYQDLDNDQVGNTAVTQSGCTQPAGYVLANGDCNDNNASIVAPVTYYVDADNDGFGDDASAMDYCQPQAGLITIGGDCNDANNAVYPGATEICDGLDNNCNDQTDEGLATDLYYFDGDSDGFGIGNGVSSCLPIAGYATSNGDCDDSNNTVYPGATDTEGNGIDENCDSVDGVLGLSGLAFESAIAPNPASDVLTIALSQFVAGTIEVLDLNGKVILSSAFQAASFQLVTTSLKEGTYLVRIQANQVQHIHRLVIQ
ncbi:MAG: hypothetical protein RLZZ301_253 [Bacteroidota bacterium]